MRDARLAELQFLSELNASGSQSIALLQGGGALVGSNAVKDPYGLNSREFKAMLFHLLRSGYLNGPTTILLHPAQGGTLLERHPDNDIRDLLRDQPVPMEISHKGRLRLWELRDDLLSKRKMEPMGILFSAELRERDLEVAFLFLPTGQPLSLIFSDMDNFKAVNDTLGHEAGDNVMARYLEILRDVSTGMGDAYRGVGDEVTLILPGFDGRNVDILAKDICGKVQKEFQEMPLLITLASKPTASIGAATFLKRTPPANALKFVDDLMYEAKKQGKNRVVFKQHTG